MDELDQLSSQPTSKDGKAGPPKTNSKTMQTLRTQLMQSRAKLEAAQLQAKTLQKEM